MKISLVFRDSGVECGVWSVDFRLGLHPLNLCELWVTTRVLHAWILRHPSCSALNPRNTRHPRAKGRLRGFWGRSDSP